MKPQLRVCIISEANPVSWAPLYIEAFRSRCEVITVGPAPKPEDLEWWGLDEGTDAIPSNDIAIPREYIEYLEALLPEGWDPDLVVAIASSNPAPLKCGPRLRCPTVFISVDTFQNLADFEFARYYDFVFAVQREYADALRDTGGGLPHWLPLACAPKRHFPVDTPPDADVSFVGSVRAKVHHHLTTLLDALKEHFSVYTAENVFGDDYCEAIGRGKIALNISELNELNMRVFEVMSMGRLLMTDRLPTEAGLETLFEDSVHLVLYDGTADLIEKIGYYLEHGDKREAIAQAGQARVHELHTYEHRVDTLLEKVQSTIPDIAALKSLRLRHLEDEAVSYLPKVCRRLVDIGLGLPLSKYPLHKVDVDEYLGVTPAEEIAKARQGRYDVISVWPEVPEEQVDTVVLTHLESFGASVETMLARAQALLSAGGTLILQLSGEDLKGVGQSADQAALARWLLGHDLHLTHGKLTAAGGCWICARKRTKRLKPLLVELNTRYPVVGSVFPEGHFNSFPEDA
jgi:hypothetical protein